MHEEKNNLPSLRSLPDSAIHLLRTADSEILSDSEILNSFSALSRPQPTLLDQPEKTCNTRNEPYGGGIAQQSTYHIYSLPTATQKVELKLEPHSSILWSSWSRNWSRRIFVSPCGCGQTELLGAWVPKDEWDVMEPMFFPRRVHFVQDRLPTTRQSEVRGQNFYVTDKNSWL